MGTSSRPSRLIFNYKGKNYKFMSFFVDRRDNSFYFHIYRKHGETPMTCTDGVHKESSFRIHFPSYTPTGFAENKLSFHESGCIHSTDGYGKRYRDGVVGIPFRDVTSFLFFLVVAPKNPCELVELKSVDSRRDIQIHLAENTEPFAVQFAVIRKGSRELPQIPPDQNLLGGCILCQYDDKEYGLLIALIRVMKGKSGEEPPWPPFPVVLKRVG